MFPVCGGERASRFALSIGVEGFGGQFSIRFLQKNFHSAFRFLELFLTLPGQYDAFLEELHGFIERQLRALQFADHFLESRQRALKIRFFGRFRLFRYRLIHAISS